MPSSLFLRIKFPSIVGVEKVIESAFVCRFVAGSPNFTRYSQKNRYVPFAFCARKPTAINQALCDKDTFLVTLQNNIETVIIHENDQTLSTIDKRLEELQTELLKLANSHVDYEMVGDEIYRLRDEKQKLMLENVGRDELKKRIADMSTFLKKQSIALTEYDEQLIRRLIEKVTVYEDKFTVEFKSGATVDVKE